MHDILSQNDDKQEGQMNKSFNIVRDKLNEILQILKVQLDKKLESKIKQV